MSQETTKALSAEDILGIDDLEIVEVQVSEWKGSVHLRVLPADEGLELNERMQALGKEPKHQAEAIFLLLGACLVTKDGKRLFATDEQQAKLRSRSNKVLLRLQRKALELQGWLEGAPAKNA